MEITDLLDPDCVELDLHLGHQGHVAGVAWVDRELHWLLSKWHWSYVKQGAEPPRATVSDFGRRTYLSLPRMVWLLSTALHDGGLAEAEAVATLPSEMLTVALTKVPRLTQVVRDKRDYRMSNLMMIINNHQAAVRTHRTNPVIYVDGDGEPDLSVMPMPRAVAEADPLRHSAMPMPSNVAVDDGMVKSNGQ